MVVVVHADTTVIPASSFSSYSELETYWDYLYPWGSDHNGGTSGIFLGSLIHLSLTQVRAAARMVGSSSDHSHIAVASSTLSLIATPTSGANPPTSSANPHPTIKYARYNQPIYRTTHISQYLSI